MIDAESIRDGEPSAIEAVFFLASSSDDEIAYARAVHAKLLAAHGFRDGDPGTPPLVLVDLVSGGSAPFALPGKAWLG